MARVLLKDITKVYEGDVTAVQKVSFEIADKEFMVLVGPSGCGKSTLLRMIAGLEDITGGELYIGDRLVNDVSPKDRDIAMVFQNYALYPHMSVYDNMAFGLKLRNYPKAEIEKRVNDAADILELTEYLGRKPKALSGGQRQRVAVGRAIVRKPQVFLFDEPLSNLDAKLRVQMRTEISKLHTRLQATMIYVTHDQVEAMTMGDRIVVMKKGIIQQIECPLSLYDEPNNMFVASFIGSPPMNFISGRLVDAGVLMFESKELKVKVSPSYVSALQSFVNKDIVFGIRPEHIYLTSDADTSTFTATVEVVEPMGNEIFLYLSVGNEPIVARVTTRNEPAIGSQLRLGIQMDYVHFFDKHAETKIR